MTDIPIIKQHQTTRSKVRERHVKKERIKIGEKNAEKERIRKEDRRQTEKI